MGVQTFGLALGLLTLSTVAAGCSTAASVPDIAPATDRVVGVVWFDDGDGAIENDEPPGTELSVWIGQDVFRIGAPVMTDQHGGFVLDLSPLGLEPADDYFVEATWLVPGPAGVPVAASFRQPVGIPGFEPVLVPLPTIKPCEAELHEALGNASRCGPISLPDLVPLVDNAKQPPTSQVATASARVDLETKPGAVLLRFASATANLGDGPLHMIPDSEPNDNNALLTWQRIWTDDDQYIDLQTGKFIFHEGHDHFHLNAFEQYRLLDLSGDVIKVGEKISFCLIDSVEVAPTAPHRGFGVFPDVACESARDQQVLNQGWADYYGAGLPDQWIDITGVPPGDYLVEIIVDPDDLLVEVDETNNRGTFPITLQAADLGG